MNLFTTRALKFDTSLQAIEERIDSINPVAYGRTRNFINGDVTYLSPYISRGVISTKQVFEAVMERGYKPYQIEKFIQELAWRDYWQQVWIAKENAIDQDLRHPQPEAQNSEIPQAVIDAKTGIEAIDNAITAFYQTGYLHNHVRMYIASICCNVGKSHWKQPAKWMYYYLLDGDWASNALSWQWVAGANSNKKYYANQGNINKFCYTKQGNTFLDVSYEELPLMDIPSALKKTVPFILETKLPEQETVHLDPALPNCIYNYYNLDPHWKKEDKVNRILLLEPSHFKKYPISKKCMQFILDLGQNIPNIQVIIGEFNEVKQHYNLENIFFKEHPTTNHYQGTREVRDWMFPVTGYYRSFFAYWKKCAKALKHNL